MTTLQEKQFLTLDEISERFGVSKSYLYKRTSARDLSFTKIGKTIHVSKDEIERFFASKVREAV